MDKVKNEEVKEYLVNLAISYFDNCKLFSKILGKNFARKKLKSNLTEVYTNEVSNDENGYASKDGSITICTVVEKENPLTVEEISSKTTLKNTVLHEAVHVILLKKGRITGTGILESYDNGTELGRGLNEGLTNWILKKAGLCPQTYVTLTSIIEFLELGIGEERVMKMAKGNIMGNVARQLKMTPRQCNTFFAITDEIYIFDRYLKDFSKIIEVLEKYEGIEGYDKDEQEHIIKQYKELEKNEIYIDFLSDGEYKEKLQETNLQDSVTSRKNYFKLKKYEYESKYEQNLHRVQGIIYRKYFEKELAMLKHASKITPEIMKKFDKLYEFVCEKRYDSSDIENFKKSYRELNEKYLYDITKKAQNEFENGNLCGKKIKELCDEIDTDASIRIPNFLLKLSKNIAPNNYSTVTNFLSFLYQNGQMEEINDYSILKLNTENTMINVYQKNGETIGIDDDLGIFTLDEEKLSAEDIIFSIEFTKRIQEENPKAKVRNLDKLIIVENDGQESYYIIENGKAVEPSIETIHMDNILNTTSKYENFKVAMRDMSKYSECVPQSGVSNENETIVNRTEK